MHVHVHVDAFSAQCYIICKFVPKFMTALLYMFVCTYHHYRQCLSLPSPSQEVVLCALFCQPLGHAPSLTMPTSPVPCKHRSVAGPLSVSSHLTSPVPDRSALTLSPVKVHALCRELVWTDLDYKHEICVDEFRYRISGLFSYGGIFVL